MNKKNKKNIKNKRILNIFLNSYHCHCSENGDKTKPKIINGQLFIIKRFLNEICL